MSEPALPIVRSVVDLRAMVASWKRAGDRVGLVPTMGSLHEGHLSLVTLAKTRVDRVVASVFVNPTQFGPNEDFDAYPRDEAKDAALLAGVGCDLLFAPTVAEMYPPGAATTVTVSGVTDSMDGIARPGHFAGVATIVTKLLLQALPDVAVFGEKDYQQLQVIKRLTVDLDIPTEIIGAPIARAADGLALSSRNAYLTPPEREIAGQLNKILADGCRRLRAGESVERVEATGLAAIERAGFHKIDYFEVRNAVDLSHPGMGPLTVPGRILTAATIGRTRLIDNMAV